jgi:hypothetical protein
MYIVKGSDDTVYHRNYWVLGPCPSTGIYAGRWTESKRPVNPSKIYVSLCETKSASLCYA